MAVKVIRFKMSFRHNRKLTGGVGAEWRKGFILLVHEMNDEAIFIDMRILEELLGKITYSLFHWNL